MFAKIGIPVIDTDIIAREVVEAGQPGLREVEERFGNEVIDADGNLDRAAMRHKIFSDENAKRDLEAILHPRIGAETRRQADEAGGIYQIIVVPLLTGSALLRFVDRVLVVDCDEQTQVERLLRRDAETAAQARRIIAAQANREERLAIADDVILNDNGLNHVRNKVIELDRKYRRLAAQQYQRARHPENT